MPACRQPQAFREEGFDGTISLISDERDLPYHKPPLLQDLRQGRGRAAAAVARRGILHRPRHHIAFGNKVEQLDLASRSVGLAGGDRLGFDKLILATGARPRPLAMPGVDLAGVAVLRTLDDARAIRDMAKSAGEVVVIGAGFIGLEIAATLAAGGRKVTVVEAACAAARSWRRDGDRGACAPAARGAASAS